MLNRHPLAFATIVVGLLLAAWKSAPTGPTTLRQIETQHVAGPLYMLTGNGGNLGVSVGPDGVLLIDDKFANLAEEIQEALDALAEDADLASGTPRFLVNTHHHGDHTGGNPFFGKKATIVAHENVRKRLSEPGASNPMAPTGLPIVTFADGLSIHFNGEELKLVHLAAGHTDNDTVVYFTGSNVVHTGDLCFNRLFPFIDTAGGGSLAGYIADLDLLIRTTNEDTRFIPGHGALANRADLEALSGMLKTVKGLVQAELDAGKSIQDMQDEKLLARFDAWNWSFITADKLIDTVAKELGGQ